jgi:hypothetical protein
MEEEVFLQKDEELVAAWRRRRNECWKVLDEYFLQKDEELVAAWRRRRNECWKVLDEYFPEVLVWLIASWLQRPPHEQLIVRGTEPPKAHHYSNDKNIVMTVDTYLTADLFCENLTVEPNVVLYFRGYRIFVKNLLTASSLGCFSGDQLIRCESTTSLDIGKSCWHWVIEYNLPQPLLATLRIDVSLIDLREVHTLYEFGTSNSTNTAPVSTATVHVWRSRSDSSDDTLAMADATEGEMNDFFVHVKRTHIDNSVTSGYGQSTWKHTIKGLRPYISTNHSCHIRSIDPSPDQLL